ncbi:TIGR02450 family Trp-rich protein [Photobacterium alginatilyticum]|uniref:TIGR02450 family Trp-rich protein n=1 Tax=Photobacterium alginatilyticum TaxID=1775171 RepID=UPI004068F788
MNRIHPKALLNSKWTKVHPVHRERHFVVTLVEFDEHHKVKRCVIEAVINRHEYELNWRELTDSLEWQIGWH